MIQIRSNVEMKLVLGPFQLLHCDVLCFHDDKAHQVPTMYKTQMFGRVCVLNHSMTVRYDSLSSELLESRMDCVFMKVNVLLHFRCAKFLVVDRQKISFHLQIHETDLLLRFMF